MNKFLALFVFAAICFLRPATVAAQVSNGNFEPQNLDSRNIGEAAKQAFYGPGPELAAEGGSVTKKTAGKASYKRTSQHPQGRNSSPRLATNLRSSPPAGKYAAKPVSEAIK